MYLASVFGIFNDLISQFLSTPGSEIWVYVLMGSIIFVETGLVLFPFLPGDTGSCYFRQTASARLRVFSLTIMFSYRCEAISVPLML